MFCPECGADHHAEEREGRERVADLELAIAKVQAQRDVELARITAGVVKDSAVQEAEVVVAEAEGIAEGVEMGAEAVADAVIPEEVVEIPAEASPVVVHEMPEESAPDVEPPPSVEEMETVPSTKKRPGWWDAYR